MILYRIHQLRKNIKQHLMINLRIIIKIKQIKKI